MIYRPFTIEEEMSSRSHTEKQFSIDSILGKEVYVDLKNKHQNYSNKEDFDSFMPKKIFFQQKLEQDERENTDYSSYFRNNSQQKSFYREIHEFGKNRKIVSYVVMYIARIVFERLNF